MSGVHCVHDLGTGDNLGRVPTDDGTSSEEDRPWQSGRPAQQLERQVSDVQQLVITAITMNGLYPRSTSMKLEHFQCHVGNF